MNYVSQKLRLSGLKIPLPSLIGAGIGIIALLCAMQVWPSDSAPHFRQDDKDKELVAKGRKAFDEYRCFDCHGPKGEGTDDGPDLTISKLTAEQVSKTLQHPSADADARGMPAIPADSPDLQPLVAFVLSLRKPPAK
jgi:mono/diheme cytochrome c family protein